MIELFAHRGFVTKNIPENSIKSLKKAYKLGFRAVEFDIWFFDNKLLLKHDRPKKDDVLTLPNLTDYFSFGNEIKYWMDFKNLNQRNITQALKILKTEIKLAKIDLKQIYFAPFILDHKKALAIFQEIRKVFGANAQVTLVCEKLKTKKDIEKLHDFLTKNKIKFLSIFHKLIDKNLVEILSKIEFFAWTVNDLNRLRELENIGVKNIVTDKNLIHQNEPRKFRPSRQS